MHIPQGPTDSLTLLPFDAALADALQPSPDYDVARWLYVPNTSPNTGTFWAPGVSGR